MPARTELVVGVAGRSGGQVGWESGWCRCRDHVSHDDEPVLIRESGESPTRTVGDRTTYAPSSMLEIHDLAEFDAHIERSQSLDGVVVQGVDLSERSRVIESVSCVGGTFLGCRLAGDALEHVIDGGAVVFPRLPAIPFDPYRPHLYEQGELLAGWNPAVAGSFDADALDSRIYRWSASHPKGGPLPVVDALAQRLHDHAIDDALGAHLARPPRRRRRHGRALDAAHRRCVTPSSPNSADR